MPEFRLKTLTVGVHKLLLLIGREGESVCDRSWFEEGNILFTLRFYNKQLVQSPFREVQVKKETQCYPFSGLEET